MIFPQRMPAQAVQLFLALITTAAGSAQAAKPSKPLNDSGATLCYVNQQFSSACAGTGQDGEFGRDVTQNTSADGAAGFSYTKVCNSGELAGTGACPAAPVLGSGANDWACTQDNVTKLIWEVKTSDGGLRDWRKIYANRGDGVAIDTSGFVAQVNLQGLCGANDWQLPNVHQLTTLVNHGVKYPGPAIDQSWFPNTTSANNPSVGAYWAANVATNSGFAWDVVFSDGQVRQDERSGYHTYIVFNKSTGEYEEFDAYGFSARLVRSGK